MQYELAALLIVTGAVLAVRTSGRWIPWPFSYRALYWSGIFSYLLLLGLPRIFVFWNADTAAQLLFWLFLAAVFAWILSYHEV